MSYLFATLFLALALLVGLQPGMAPAGLGIGAMALLMLWRSRRRAPRRPGQAPQRKRRARRILPRADREGGND